MAAPPSRSKDDPWKLKTPPGTSGHTMNTVEKDGKAILVCTVGSAVLAYDARFTSDPRPTLRTVRYAARR